MSSGDPEVSGMGNVDGNGVLETGSAGTATWLIIPYSEAAPTHDVQYDIGGELYYSVGGQNITVPLFPETITVTPDPRLYLNYFLERNVRSDDPMTEGTVVFSTKASPLCSSRCILSLDSVVVGVVIEVPHYT